MYDSQLLFSWLFLFYYDRTLGNERSDGADRCKRRSQYDPYGTERERNFENRVALLVLDGDTANVAFVKNLFHF